MSIYWLEVLRFSKTRDFQAIIWISQLYLILDKFTSCRGKKVKDMLIFTSCVCHEDYVKNTYSPVAWSMCQEISDLVLFPSLEWELPVLSWEMPHDYVPHCSWTVDQLQVRLLNSTPALTWIVTQGLMLWSLQSASSPLVSDGASGNNEGQSRAPHYCKWQITQGIAIWLIPCYDKDGNKNWKWHNIGPSLRPIL